MERGELVARALALAIVVSLLAVSGAGGSDAQTPKSGGTVVVGPVAEPNCLNPLTVSTCGAAILTFFWILEKVLTPTFAVAPDFSLRPSLVSRVTYTTKPPFTLTYHIRPEPRWSDGVPVSARDFVFTHDAIRKRLPGELFLELHRNVRSIRIVDAKTVRVVLRTRDAGWHGLFAEVLPEHALRGENLKSVWRDRIDNPKTGRPIGNGPFLIERWERGKQLTLIRNPRYWGPHVAHLDRLVVRFRAGIPPSLEVLESLRRGELDFALFRDTALVPDLRRLRGMRIFPTTTTGWEHIDIRVRAGGHPALRDKRVRRALAYGIDRVAIARALWSDVDPRYEPSDSAVFLANHRSYERNWNGYRYRPAESRRLLEQAGCRSGADGIYVCDGRRLELRLFTTAGVRFRERHVQLVQGQLRQVGIEVVLGFAAPAALFTQILPNGDFDLASFAWFVPPDASGRKGLFGCGGAQNFSGYCQRLLTKDLDQADRIFDAGRREAILNRADRQLAKRTFR
jgi:peptide/nickel transport system substrate-binding protein